VNAMTALQAKRGAVNVEYILLIVVGALSVVLGLTALGSAMNTKHQQIATALADKSVASIGVFAPYQPGDTGNNTSTFGAISIGYDTQPNPYEVDGLVHIAASNPNGIAPFPLFKDGVQVATSGVSEFVFDDGFAICVGNGAPTSHISTYTIKDASGVTSAVATDEFRCINCHGADYATNGYAPTN
jgi:Flp pilus assembly pilin Flp